MLQVIGRFLLRVRNRIKVFGFSDVSTDTPTIIAPNHLSDFDGPMMLMLLGSKVTFFMDGDHYKIPILNWICKLVGCIPVYKGRSNRDSLEAGIKALRSGKSVVIFPEGKRCKPGELGRFRKGVAVLARETGLPVVPVGIIGTDQVIPPHKPWIPRPHPITVKFGEPVYIQKWESLESFTERLKGEVAMLCGNAEKKEELLYVSSD